MSRISHRHLKLVANIWKWSPEQTFVNIRHQHRHQHRQNNFTSTWLNRNDHIWPLVTIGVHWCPYIILMMIFKQSFSETDCILNVLTIVWLTFEPWLYLSIFRMTNPKYYSVSKNGEVLIVTVYVISPLYGFNKSF